MSYPAWQKTNLDNNGRWKLRKGKGLKVEDNNNNNNNNSTDEISKKQKSSHHACKLEELEKKFKESYQGKDNIPQSSSLSSLSPPPSNSSALLGSVQLSPKLSSKDFPPTMQGTLITRSTDNTSSEVVAPALFCNNMEKQGIPCSLKTPTPANNIYINLLDALTAAATKA
ncbi:hypothetical protein J3A83DRAFT_2704740, partial [Scleroderma citrinum]